MNEYFPAGQEQIDNLPDDGWTQEAVDEVMEECTTLEEKLDKLYEIEETEAGGN